MKQEEALTNEERLDRILLHLERLDRRDKIRTWGGLVHGILSLIPTVLLLLGLWYFYNNSAAIMQSITQQAAQQAAAVASGIQKGAAVSLPITPDVIKQLKQALHLK